MTTQRTNKRSRTHFYSFTLTDNAFRNIVDITAKAMKDCASFNPVADSPEKLREKYMPLYTRLADLISEDGISKEDKATDISLSYGIVVTNFNFIHGHVSYEFRRSIGGIEWKYVVNFTNEDENYVTIATKGKNQFEAKHLRMKYAFV